MIMELEAAGRAAFAVAGPIGEHADRATALEAEMLRHPQISCPLIHMFAKNTYVRQITMPANSIIVGHQHKTDHVNNIVAGRCLVVQDGEPEMLEAPHVFVSAPGVRKALLIYEDTIWQTVHIVDLPEDQLPTTDGERDALIARFEDELVVPSSAWLEHYKNHELVDDMRTLTHYKE